MEKVKYLTDSNEDIQNITILTAAQITRGMPDIMAVDQAVALYINICQTYKQTLNFRHDEKRESFHTTDEYGE
jgi:hypothetical protein